MFGGNKKVWISDGKLQFKDGSTFESAKDPEYFAVFPNGSPKVPKDQMKTLKKLKGSSVGYCTIQDFPEGFNFQQDHLDCLDDWLDKVVIYKRSMYDKKEYFPISRYYEFTEKATRDLLSEALQKCQGVKFFRMKSHFYQLDEKKSSLKASAGVDVSFEAQVLLLLATGATAPSGEFMGQRTHESRDEDETALDDSQSFLPPVKETKCMDPSELGENVKRVVQLFGGLKGALESNFKHETPRTLGLESYTYIRLLEKDEKFIQLQAELGIVSDFVTLFAKGKWSKSEQKQMSKLFHLKVEFYAGSEFVETYDLGPTDYESTDYDKVPARLQSYVKATGRKKFVVHLCGTQNVGKSSFILTSMLALTRKKIVFDPKDLPSKFPLVLRNSLFRGERQEKGDGTKYSGDHLFNNYTVYKKDNCRILMNDTMGLDVSNVPLVGFQDSLEEFEDCIYTTVEKDGTEYQTARKSTGSFGDITTQFMQNLRDGPGRPNAYIIMADIDVLNQRISRRYRVSDSKPPVHYDIQTNDENLRRHAKEHNMDLEDFIFKLGDKLHKGNREIDALMKMIKIIKEKALPYIVLLNKRDVIDRDPLYGSGRTEQIAKYIQAMIELYVPPNIEDYGEDERNTALHEAVSNAIDLAMRANVRAQEVLPHSCCRTVRPSTISDIVNAAKDGNIKAEVERYKRIYDSTILAIASLIPTRI